MNLDEFFRHVETEHDCSAEDAFLDDAEDELSDLRTPQWTSNEPGPFVRLFRKIVQAIKAVR